ncbi:hypothetical protein [Actinocorallia populi]|uniref:hypothetical protein n=1 Tax=Actinocorallia populi TaxID=2079200 RepID=UPI000D093F28|nr:hypothetical protein [Actinocorallia populi]
MRHVAVLAGRGPAQAPPGVDPDAWRLALLEDVYELAESLDQVTAVMAAPAALRAEAEALTWPGAPVLTARTPLEVLEALAAGGATEVVVLVPDAPDLPGLLVGKLFRALATAPAAVCPAPEGLVALAVRLPLPAWLAGALAGLTLQTPDALARLRAAADFPGQVQRTPGWHRLRAPADVHLLDPGLEGWENTRLLLSTPARA